MGSSSLTKDWTQASCIGSTVLTTGPPGTTLLIPVALWPCWLDPWAASSPLLPCQASLWVFHVIMVLDQVSPQTTQWTHPGALHILGLIFGMVDQDFLLVSWRVSPFCIPTNKIEIFLWIWSPTYGMLSAVLILLFLNGAEYFLMSFLFFGGEPKCTVYKILVPWPGIKPGSTAVKVPSPNHWTAKEVAVSFILTCIPNHLTAVNWPMQFALMWKTVHEWPSFLLGYLLLGHRCLFGYFMCVWM